MNDDFQNGGNNYGQSAPNYGTNQQMFEIKATIQRADAETYVKWGKIYGIVLVIMGALACLSCFGIVYGIPYIMAGLNFNRASQSLERSLLYGDETGVTTAFNEIARGIKTMGILEIVMIILAVIGFVFMIVAMLALPEFINSLPRLGE